MLRRQALRLHFDELVKNNQSGLIAEYNQARSVAERDPGYHARLTVSTPQVSSRNRYRDVITLDDTRVKLGNGDSDYINANFVKTGGGQSGTICKTIVCQAPLPTTSEHFWQMCWEQNVLVIVMLTGFYEPCNHGTGVLREKSFAYFNPHAKQEFGAFGVEVVESSELALGWTRRRIRLEYRKGGPTREIEHVHCTSWPDFGALQAGDLEGLAKALKVVELSRMNNPGSPPVVHCSAGIGRSGTFVALDALLALAKQGEWDEVDPLKMVPLLRNQRPGLVQTAEQYGMIYQVLLKLLME
ncbi:hypothetical protein BASA81_010604 [Batrachochytrium salamandrivorans]|nr:hypothetical protein BASA81_010604 [Batrachochytrium salamandrivorans]